MRDNEEFDLSLFLTDSLSLQANSSSQTRMMKSKSFSDPYTTSIEQDPLEVLGEKSFGQPKYIPEEVIGTPIQEFYRGSNVFISGGTGFLGKILTEKLVRSVPHLGKIYLLIRSKRGKGPQERFKELLEDQVFRRMKTEIPDYKNKITFISGDVSEPDLGLSAQDRQTLTDKVNIVFHSAADVRFTEPLKRAISSNVFGSMRMIELAKDMTHLKAYVHVSTAFSQCVRRVIPETIPALSVNYKDVLSKVESMTEEEIENNLSSILQGWPNTYTFTKAVCEEMILAENKGLPISVFRPSAVVSTYDEPVRAWVDNTNGPMGLFLASCLGILHCIKADEELATDMVPVDYVVNCMIAAAWNTHNNRNQENELVVYNYVSTPHNITPWKFTNYYGEKHLSKWPYNNAVWYLSLCMTNSNVVDEGAHLLLHKIPGVFLDKVAILMGQKPRLTKIYDKLQSVKTVLRWFMCRTWEFESENVQKLMNSLSQEDKKVFNFDLRNVNSEAFSSVMNLGIRYYYLKESMESLPAAKRKNNRLFWAHNLLKLVSGLALLKVLVMVAHALPF